MPFFTSTDSPSLKVPCLLPSPRRQVMTKTRSLPVGTGSKARETTWSKVISFDSQVFSRLLTMILNSCFSCSLMTNSSCLHIHCYYSDHIMRYKRMFVHHR